MNRTQLRTNQRRKGSDRLTRILLIAFGVLAVITAIVAFKVVQDVVAQWSMTDLPGLTVNPTADPNKPPVLPSGIEGNTPLQGADGPKPDPWDGKSRVTVLVMGLDYRDWEENNNAPRSDSLILLTIDPLTKTAGILSIPRDMWVDIPGGYGYNKINMAYRLGELDDLPGGGPSLAMKAVESFIGVPINYYAQIDFQAFEGFIDEIDGVKVEIKEEMVLDPVGPAPKVKVAPGVYTLPGDLALAYARNRYTDGDDFTRSERQQQVIMAIRDRILDFNMLPKLVARAPALYKELASGIRTNLTPEQVIKLSWLAIQIDQKDIKKGVIGPPKQVDFGWSPDGTQAILLPVPDEIRLLRDEIFSSAPVAAATVNEDPRTLAADEAARISVQNGTAIGGLAGRTAEFLRENGLNVVEEGNSTDLYNQTTVLLYNSKPYTARYMSEIMNLPALRVYNKYDPNMSVDMVVIIGADWAESNTLPEE